MKRHFLYALFGGLCGLALSVCGITISDDFWKFAGIMTALSIISILFVDALCDGEDF